MKDRVYTADMGSPPQDIDGGSAAPMPSRRPKPAMKRPAPPMKRPAPKGEGMFREGMPVPQDIDGGSVKYAKGGSVSARADGIAKRGRTNCKMV